MVPSAFSADDDDDDGDDDDDDDGVGGVDRCDEEIKEGGGIQGK